MKPFHRMLGLSLVIGLALPVLGADEKKDKKGEDKEDKKADKKPDKLVSSGNFVARLMSVSAGSDKTFKVQIQQKYLVPNPQAQADLIRRQADLLRQQQQIMMNRNPIQRQQQLAQLYQRMLQQAPPNLYQVKEYKKDIELRAADDMKVRTMQPPVDYDDKGNVKKYTPKELKELKGPDPSLPGYQADFDALRDGQMVKVYLSAKKKAPAPKKAKKKMKDKDKEEDADAADETKDDKRPEAIMVVVVSEPADRGKER